MAMLNQELQAADFKSASYAYARYLLLYLQEQGKLTEFYAKFAADKRTPPARPRSKPCSARSSRRSSPGGASGPWRCRATTAEPAWRALTPSCTSDESAMT
jgi:hypothetical protein